MKREGFFMLMLLLAAAALAGACGGSSSKTDGDAQEDELTLPDGDAEADMPADVPADESVVPDLFDTTDPVPDDPVEAVPEVEEDGDPADAVDDEAIDAPVDIPGEEFPSHCTPMQGTITDLYSWTLAWMGTGTNAAFTLQISNPNAGPDCVFSGITVSEAWLKRSGDDSTVIRYATVDPNPDPPASTLNPGQSSSGGLIARHDDSTTSDCATQVYVELKIDYTIDGTDAVSTTVLSPAVSHECVY